MDGWLLCGETDKRMGGRTDRCRNEYVYFDCIWLSTTVAIVVAVVFKRPLICNSKKTYNRSLHNIRCWSYCRKHIPEEEKRKRRHIAGELRKHLQHANKPEQSLGAGLGRADRQAQGGWRHGCPQICRRQKGGAALLACPARRSKNKMCRMRFFFWLPKQKRNLNFRQVNRRGYSAGFRWPAAGKKQAAVPQERSEQK